MNNYAVVENDKIVNVVVAESAEIAAEVTGATVIETTGVPWIDWQFVNNEWRSPQPYPSWTWVDGSWNAPITKPHDDDSWIWNEDILSWEQQSQETEVPILLDPVND